MTVSTLLLLLAGYLIFAAIFLGLDWRSTRHAKWGGLAAIAAAAPVFFWLGAFGEQFGAGLCYSEVVHAIAGAVEASQDPGATARQIRDLPMHGYETSCAEVEAAARKLPGAGTR